MFDHPFAADRRSVSPLIIARWLDVQPDSTRCAQASFTHRKVENETLQAYSRAHVAQRIPKGIRTLLSLSVGHDGSNGRRSNQLS